MKYIRTRDGRILKVFKDNVSLLELNDGLTYYGKDTVDFGTSHYLPKSEILKQADTIEELIDEYVLVEKSAKCFLNYDEITEDDLKLCLQDHDIFGAIWTYKGLIYVAKMNEKGELVLL